MPCGGCGRRAAALKDMKPPEAPRAVMATPPPPPPAPSPRSLSPGHRPVQAPMPKMNITVQSQSRLCPKCGQKATFVMKWNDRLRRYYEESSCPCSK